jgi:hypothetical protein
VCSLLGVAVAASRRGQKKSGVLERSVDSQRGGSWIVYARKQELTINILLNILLEYSVGLDPGRKYAGYSHVNNSQQEVPVRTYPA